MARQSQPAPAGYQAESFVEGVLTEELRQILERRKILGNAVAPDDPGGRPPGESNSDGITARVQQASTFGVALSGGGIRSATFNLGVLQGLAENRLLPHIDYLSTVSGGGYIGAWLHGLIRRRQGDPRLVRETLLSGMDRQPGPPDRDPVTFLRKYSNYLAPRPGLFSADTWVGVLIWLRNALLNQLILIPAIAAAATMAFLLVLVRQIPFVDQSGLGVNKYSAILALLGLLVAVLGLVANLRPIARQSVEAVRIPPKGFLEAFAERHAVFVVIGLFVAATALAYGDFDLTSPRVVAGTAAGFVLLMVLVQVGGGFVACFANRHQRFGRLRARLHVAWMATISGLVSTALVWTAWHLVQRAQPWTLVAFGPPLIALALIAGVMLLVGLMGVDYPDAAREWTARIGSQFAIIVAAWTVLFALMVFGPWAVAWLFASFQWTGVGVVSGWLMTTIGGVLAGRSGRTGSGRGTGTKGALELLVNVAPTVFLVGYIVIISAGVHSALSTLTPTRPDAAPTASSAPAIRYDVGVRTTSGAGVEVTVDPARNGVLDKLLAPAVEYAARYSNALTLDYAADGLTQPGTAALLLFGFIFVVLVASSRINVNEFSLHHFYKNRLVRCYLGASNSADGSREPNTQTGFDPLDDFPLAALKADNASTRPPGDQPYLGPYPIVNATLNLNTGSELAQQERKAASFVFTPAFCGFDPPSSRESAREMRRPHQGMDEQGYRPTWGYAQPAGPQLGTSVSISGAAANPNWGYHTSGPMAFLLTVFNARLGWWLGNPRWVDQSRHAGPRFALIYLFAELLGQTTGRSKFVNLSDGGHFENLGLYELVRRRCRFIIVSDSEEDGGLTFGSLGGAIRKCRADFGVEIDIDPEAIHAGPQGYSRVHCVVGRIIYPEPEQAFAARMTDGLQPAPDGAETRSQGWLLYLKASLTGDEPADVLEYRSRYGEFPHQSTNDQFFSESQFESYRRLGLHVLRSAFEGAALPPEPPAATPTANTTAAPDALRARYPLVRTFQDLTRKWYAAGPITAEAASRLADDYVKLTDRLADRASLRPLYQQLLHGEPSTGTPSTGRPDPELIAFGIQIMQLIENVYTEFGFESPFNEQNPRNAGWINLFRKWLRSDILFHDIWPHISGDYQPFFREFVKRLREATDRDPTRL
ncbi:MAG: patatin-like phospholipase family protein [Acidobacteriota bacterium]